MDLFLHHTIHLDASVGTHQSATLAADTLLRLSHVGEMIATIVHFFLLQRQHILRTSDRTQIAALATLDVNRHSTFDFCHSELVLC